MTDPGPRQRLAAILAADVAGYSRLMTADDHATVAALDRARETFRARIASHQGRVIDMAGDSVLAVFDTAIGAVTAALAIQEDLEAAALSVPDERRMRFRIGIHLGDVIEKADGTVYGDGVNIAARLESLARPGGITVSDAVRTLLRGRVAATFEDQGERAVKNIAEPVHAYAVHPGRSAPGPTAGPVEAPVVAPPTRSRPSRRWLALAAASVLTLALIGAVTWYATGRFRTADPPPIPAETGALPLPGKPSIAVLPFENLSGEAEQAYFADGITEDLITDLSKVSGLFVIARNSTFVYKGKSHDVREVARTLGVRYVLEGSVRRSGGDIRVNAQLVDATTGGHVWADRYDGDMKNIFGLQDKVTHSVVTAMAVELTRDDRARVARRGTENAQAYDVFLKGWEQYLRQSPEGFRAAIEYFKQAATLDPSYTRAYAALAATYWEAATRYWDIVLGFRRHHEAQYQAEQYLAKAMRDPTPLAHQVSSAMLLIAAARGGDRGREAIDRRRPQRRGRLHRAGRRDELHRPPDRGPRAGRARHAPQPALSALVPLPARPRAIRDEALPGGRGVTGASGRPQSRRPLGGPPPARHLRPARPTRGRLEAAGHDDQEGRSRARDRVGSPHDPGDHVLVPVHRPAGRGPARRRTAPGRRARLRVRTSRPLPA